MGRPGVDAPLLLAAFAMLALRGAGVGLQGVPVALTPDELHTVDSLLSTVGHDQHLASTVTQILGLTKPGETLVVRLVSGREEADTAHQHVHFFIRSKSDPRVIILLFRSPGVTHGFRTDTSFSYRAGFAADPTPRPIPVSEGRAEMVSEIRWWAQKMDSLKH